VDTKDALRTSGTPAESKRSMYCRLLATLASGSLAVEDESEAGAKVAFARLGCEVRLI
jgi:hypothetical protein